MNRRRHHLLVTICAILACLSAARAADPAPAEDPWSGKTKTDVTNLLGEPTKAKKSADGSLLTYKLLRLEQDAIPSSSMIVLDVPGIGVVARMLSDYSSGGSDVTIEPTELDRQGRGTGGGVGEQESASISWNTESKTTERSWEERPAIRGKLTLKFRIDPSGAIESWSVSPKKAAARP
jgi:hypothetical protein